MTACGSDWADGNARGWIFAPCHGAQDRFADRSVGTLSTLFFFSGQIDPTQSIPYRELDVESIAREQRLSSPSSSGVTDDGSAFALTADRALPDPSDETITRFENLNIELLAPDTGVKTFLCTEWFHQFNVGRNGSVRRNRDSNH